MKLTEIKARLREVFPDRVTCFSISVWNHSSKSGPADADDIKLQLWDQGLHNHFDCTSLEDGIAQIQAALLPKPPTDDMDVEGVAGEPVAPQQVCCRLCGTTVPVAQARKHYCEHVPEGKVEADDIIMGSFIPLKEPVIQAPRARDTATDLHVQNAGDGG
jgi:hypothetical protein